ncbi:restriction endonuclease subunit S [Domibacillus sp. A3M-37]|uniref:restriction endonuclease subunit S n=1 Tax=Domibacillus sp. A3M-37 TaxID=2962037 RepID=UPI0020B714DC|nr:restriction endonuclease subunit S [Domibacillus sp. A3M-37]MCP3763748.1 restriction endonuclease subunit S [Domibacillus sp. A3M-37]
MIYKLKDVLKEKGYIRGPFGSALKKADMKEDGIPVYEQQHAIYKTRDFRYFIDEEKYQKMKRFSTEANDILVSCSGTLGETTILDKNNEKGIINQALLILRANEEVIVPKYLYYFFNSKRGKYSLISNSSGSVQVNIANRKVIENIDIFVPDKRTQSEIIKKIESLENKIELNNELINSLEEYSQLLFHKWFVDFNFPNEKGKPYKDNGGEMYEVNNKLIPQGWRFSEIGDVSINFDSKRIPLSDSVRQNKQGKYPYYGATEIMDYIDDYIFDGLYCLIAEDGTVIDENNKPVMQLAWNKFWVNNHAHVLRGKDEISTEFLYLTLKRTNVSGMVTGAIQKKINQTNLNKLITIHPERNVLSKFNEIISTIFEKLILIREENELLKETRDLSIQKLIK